MANDSAVVYISLKDNSVHYFAQNESNRIIHDTRKIVAIPFSEEYFKKFTDLLRDFATKYTPVKATNATIVLPNASVFNNTATFPAIGGADFNKTLDAHLVNSYPNLKTLNIKSYKAISNKQFVTMCFTGVSSSLVKTIENCCTESKFMAKNISYASNTTVAAISHLNPKFKNGTFMFLDIKEHECRYIVVVKGNVVGTLELPIGYENLAADKTMEEDVLLYTPEAELLVVNAKEKAKQKALTSAAVTQNPEEGSAEGGEHLGDITQNTEDEFNAFAGSDALVEERVAAVQTIIKTLPKKVARKLPKFMLREVPAEEDRQTYEKFRVFIKWALDVIKNNSKLVSLGNLDKVYVNLPKEYNFLFDIINEEIEENGVKFVNAGISNQKDDVTRNLELYGGFTLKGYKQATLF